MKKDMKNERMSSGLSLSLFLLWEFPYKMEGIGEWHRLRPGGSKGSKVALVMGVRRSGPPVNPEMLFKLRDFS